MPQRRTVSRLGLAGMVVLVVILVLALAAPAFAFPDVPIGHPYETAINHLSSFGIIGGYANGNFGLNDPVKRAQFSKMITGALDITPNTSTATRFTDLGTPDANGYPHRYVQTAYDYGITYGTNTAQTLFAPWSSIRRDQVVSMIVRGANNLYPGTLDTPPIGTLSLFDGVPEPHGSNLRIAEYNGLLDGLMGMGPSWSVTATATRGEVAQMLWNLIILLEDTPPPPSGDIWVYVDGTGDYPTIEAAVDDVDPGTTINLGPGVFELSDTLYIAKSLDLIGSGMGTGGTTVRYPGDVVGVGDVDFLATDIRFVNTATSFASDVVYVQNGTVDLLRCVFTGGNYVNQYGNGLLLYGSASASVTDCTFTLNDTCGIALWDSAYVDAYNCSMSDNGASGVGLFEDATGTVDQSECNGNGYHGVSANDYTEVTVQNSTCSENGYLEGNGSGVFLGGSAVVGIDNCECMDNALDGISVNDNADVTVENSRCSENGYTGVWASGIFFEEYATGSIYNCECNSNWVDGISLHDDAEVAIEHVTCSYNGEDGITFSEYSSGSILSCLCSYSQTYDGIDVHDNAYAVVQDNLCVYNEDAGIFFGDYATGTADGNECAGNYFGLYVEVMANPLITANNSFHDNVTNWFFE